MCTRLVLAALATLTIGCEGEDEGEAPRCPVCQAPAVVGALADPELTEVSGVAASAALPDVIYAHNDSGDSSRFFALARTGAARGIFTVKAAQNVDWEDIAVGPCQAGSCVFIADTGDNELARASYAVYRVAEPDAIAGGDREIAGDRIDFTYPDGPHDAEAMLVHPDSGVVTIVTKVESGPAQIHELPPSLSPGRSYVTTQVGEVQPPTGDNRFTGGSVHPAGTGVLLRTRSRLFYYPMSAGQRVATALAGAPCELPVADESMGEAATWLRSGAEIVTIGEGVGAAVHVSSCAP